MSEVVIGEAVVLDLRPARLPSRALAFAIDLLIMLTALTVLLVVALIGADFDGALAAAVGIVVVVGIFVGYPLLWETLTRGRSPGKYAMGLRVVRDDGGAISFRHALSRALAGLIIDFGILSSFTGFFAVLVSLSSARGKRIGDFLAGTVVMRERVPRASSRTTELPGVHPQLATWATGWELSAVPDDLALQARQFLVRADQLDPRVRRSLGESLATDVAARVAPPPPAGVPAEQYLAAVLGERRRRETLRLGASDPATYPGPPPSSWSTGPPSFAGSTPAGPTNGGPAAGRAPEPGVHDTRPAAPPSGSEATGSGSAGGFAPPG